MGCAGPYLMHLALKSGCALSQKPELSQAADLVCTQLLGQEREQDNCKDLLSMTSPAESRSKAALSVCGGANLL